MKSKVKTLTLILDVSISVPNPHKAKLETVLKHLLSFTEGLDSLVLEVGLRATTSTDEPPPIDVEILGGLSNSFNSLRCLSLRGGMLYPNFSKISSALSTLKTVSFDYYTPLQMIATSRLTSSNMILP